MEDTDFILSKSDDGKINSLGFSVNSILLQKGQSPMNTIGGSIMNKNIFHNMSVPAGLAQFTNSKQNGKQNGGSDNRERNNNETISEDIYSKLFKMAEDIKPNNKTQKNRNNGNKNTKKTQKNK
jgi:hypothetical protein